MINRSDDYASIFSDGRLLFWSIKKTIMNGIIGKNKEDTKKCVHSRFVGTKASSENPVTFAEWTKSKSGTVLVVFGGSDKFGITCLDFEKTGYKCSFSIFIPTKPTLSHILITATDFSTALFIDSESNFQCNVLVSGTDNSILVPGSISFQQSTNDSCLIVSASSTAGTVKQLKRNADGSQLNFEGGNVTKTGTRRPFDLLFIGSEYFEIWHSSLPSPVLLCKWRPYSYVKDEEITHIEFQESESSLILVCG